MCESHEPKSVVSWVDAALYAETYASFWSYCQAEVNFNMKGTSSSSLFGETTRDKLYNSLFLVGPHLERYMAVGFLKCLDYLLVRPRSAAHACSRTAAMPKLRSSGSQRVTGLQGVMLLLPLQAGAALLAWTRNPLKQRSIEIFHVAMLVVFVCSCITMIHVRAGGIYFWLKDISPVFLKIHAVYNALDILNKVRAGCGPLATCPQHGQWPACNCSLKVFVGRKLFLDFSRSVGGIGQEAVAEMAQRKGRGEYVFLTAQNLPE